MIEIKSTALQLYSFISKMMHFVEAELDTKERSNDLDNYKNITQIFEKLVSLVVQLNKLSKEEQWHLQETLPEEDMAIIERFMKKYSKSHGNL